MQRFFDEYSKHFALNIGQAMQGVRYLFSHPDIDAVARRGGVEHALRSACLRSTRVANDVLFALLPPQWHHSRDELAPMAAVPLRMWFKYGYCAWRFTETGEPKPDLTGVDPRWDPRCHGS